MNQRIAVVTGGAGGLGRLISTALVARDFVVVVADRDRAAGTRLVGELEGRGERAVFVETDAADAVAITRMVEQAAELGDLAVLINNAGGWQPGPQFPEPSSPWQRSLALNLVMPMLATQLALPRMTGRGGSIVNVSSSGGWGSDAYGSPEYGAAKAGLIRFTTSLSDWADRYRVRVSCVVPHWIGLDRAVEEFARMTPEEQARSGGLVDSQLVADTVVALALDETAAGRIVMLRAGWEPYEVDPAAADPMAD
jgi:NAD(P)-dependent dehydrogenase (short-subunit alcohol dehydrogenase family)